MFQKSFPYDPKGIPEKSFFKIMYLLLRIQNQFLIPIYNGFPSSFYFDVVREYVKIMMIKTFLFYG